MRYVRDKIVNNILNAMVKEGWTISKHRRHWKIHDPTGRLRAVAAVSPGDARSIANLRADLKRARESYGI